MPASSPCRRRLALVLAVAVTVAVGSAPVGAEQYSVTVDGSACNQPLQGDACLVLTCTNCSGSIPQANPKTATLTVTDAGLGSVGYQECTIRDLNTSLAYSHPRIGDSNSSILRNGDQRILWTNSGCTRTSFDATIDDEAATAQNNCNATAGGTMRANDPLNDFDGEGLDATWQLTVNSFLGTGSLQGWAIAADVDCVVTPSPQPNCTANATTACLNGDRFKVTMTYKTTQNATGNGRANELTSDTGWFWFFNGANVEVVVKVINGCGTNNNYWVFASGLTDVNVVITVEDMVKGTKRTYTNPLGTAFQPIQRTGDFPCN